MTLVATPPVARELDWLDRATCLYLLLPVFLFCFWYVSLVAAGLIALTACGAYAALRGARERSALSGRFVAAILLVSLVWTAVAGVGHYFYANADWLIRDAVLHDLSIAGWPPTYSADDGTSLILRAPVGYYLPAAIVGRLAGIGAANAGLFAWTTLGWALFMAAACSMFETRIQRIACVLVLALFGGMDLLGYVWSQGWLPPIGQHIEWWMGNVQYSSNTTLLFWVPNHALPAWLGTILLLRHWRQPTLARITPLLATAIPLWSPLAAMGLFPFFVFALAWRRDFGKLFSLRTCFPFFPAALLIAAYLGMDAAAVPHGWLIPFYSSLAEFAYRYALFCLLEFGILALILSRLTTFDAPMRIAIVVLCLFPFYFYGPGNDLAMRASIPALTVLALATVRPLTRPGSGPWRTALAVVLGIGALGAAQEPLRSLTRASWSPADRSLPEAMEAMSPDSATFFPPHYFAKVESERMQSLLRKPEPVDTTAREGM